VWDSCFFERNTNHLVPGHFAPFADGIGDFAGLAEANTDAATLIAHHDEGAEIKTAPAFDDFGGAIDEDDLLDEFLALIAIRTLFGLRTTAPAAAGTAIGPGLFYRRFCFSWFCHSDASQYCSMLKLQTGFARSVGQGFDFAVVASTAAIENDLLDSLPQRGLRGECADPSMHSRRPARFKV
jgi:hypothetical protein